MAWSRLLVVSVLALLGALATHVAPAAAQKKISVLTWNIPIYKEKIGGWIADFKQIHPDAEVEWLDKKVTLFERTLTTLEPRATVQTGPDGGFRFAGQRAHHLAVEARKEGIGRSPRTAVRLYFRGQDLVLPAPLQLGADR